MTTNVRMNTVQDHYDRMLGPVYSWIIGDFTVVCRRNAALLDSLGLRSERCALAVDLGCGPGCHSIPLAEAGFRVLAVDFCDALLNELQGRAQGLPIRTVQSDILHFRRYLDEVPQLILCMGDTLVHLPDWNAVQALLVDIVDSLAPGGTFLASLRDYSNGPPCGTDQFIPVRSTADRIFTCFLHYGEETIEVRDILQTRNGDTWNLEFSRYQKLRLDYRRIISALQDLGMKVDPGIEDQGMICIRSTRPG